MLFHTSSLAQDAVTKLHAHVYKSCLLSVTLKKRLEALTTPSSATKPVAPTRASRLILRNLPFNITSQDLRAVFLPYGPIHAIDIPTSEEGKGRGFAFVWMLSRKDAEKALEGTNGKPIKPGLADTLVGDKQKRKKVRREERKRLAALGIIADAEDEGEAKVEKERVIAVDWALSKGKWEEEQAKMLGESEAEDEDDRMSDDGDDSDSEGPSTSDEDEDESSSDEDNLGVHDGDVDVDEEDERSDNEVPIKPQLPPPETGTTLFVRNVPFSATDEDLRTLYAISSTFFSTCILYFDFRFAAYGPLRYARMTMDPTTGRPRGTGFACFWNVADADTVVEQSSLLRSEMTGTAAPLAKKNPFTLPSILTPDPSSKMAASLVLHGRTLDVVRAVTREDASKLKETGERMREKADKRNIYLLREGGKLQFISFL